MSHSVLSARPSWKNSVIAPEEQPSDRSTTLRWCGFIALAGTGTAVDLLTKQWVFASMGLPGDSPPWWLIEPYVGFETAVNPGALFGLGAGFGLIFAALSVLALIAILVWLAAFRAIHSRWLTVALGCVTGGILGNLYDRLGMWNPPDWAPAWQSGVRDWILLQYDPYVWPNFNIADSLLVCGAIMLAIHSFFFTGDKQAEPPKDPSDASPA